MINTHSYKTAKWIDIVEPTTEEINSLVSEFGIDPLVAHELRTPSERHRMEARGTYLYLILHFPILSHQKNSTANTHEIDFVVGSDFVITTRYEQIDAVDRFAKQLEVDSILDKDFPGNPRDIILFGLMNEIGKDIRTEIERIDESLKHIEDNIFTGAERKMVMALSESSRRLLDLKKIILPYRDVLKGLEKHGRDMFGEDFSFIVRGTNEEFSKNDALIKSHMESLSELRETNNSLLEIKENGLMKFLTIMNLVIAILVGIVLTALGYLAIME